MEQNRIPEFRLYYFTKNYQETIAFYRDLLELEIITLWDRGPGAKGTVFKSPNGIGQIEIEEGNETPTLHAGLYIEMENVDALYNRFVEKKCPIVQSLTSTSYGHRTFKLEDPNGMRIGFFSKNV